MNKKLIYVFMSSCFFFNEGHVKSQSLKGFKTEYQFKLNVNKVSALTEADVYAQLIEFMKEYPDLMVSKTSGSTDVIVIDRFSFDERNKINNRIDIKLRRFFSGKMDLTLKYNSPSLNEIITLFPEEKKLLSQTKIEQDIYGNYTKFSLVHREDLKYHPQIEFVYDLKKIFKNDSIIDKIDEEIELQRNKIYILRNQNIYISNKDTSIRLTFDYHFDNLNDANSHELWNITGGEISFRIEISKVQKTTLGMELFEALNKFILVTDEYNSKKPDIYY